MHTLIFDVWQTDNIEFEVEISDLQYESIRSMYEKYCDENDYPDDSESWECFFDDNDGIANELCNYFYSVVEAEIKRSIMENCDSGDDWMQEFANSSWGFSPIRIE